MVLDFWRRFVNKSGMSPIHENIRRRREELGLTQEQLGALAGLSRQQVCQYERGARTPPSRRLQQLATALQWDLNSLYGAGESGEEKGP